MKFQCLWLTIILVCTQQLYNFDFYVSAKKFLSREKYDKRNNSRWNDKVFAPYLHTGSGNKLDINNVIETTGQKFFVYAFMNSVNRNGEEIPSWNSKENKKGYEFNAGKYDQEIGDIRKHGGDIIISFGGYGGRELATVINDEDTLYNAYSSVIEYYNLSWIDLDIEGDNLKNEKANILRNNVLLSLQKNYPNLTISYCLSAKLNGIKKEGIKLLSHAKDIGLRIDIVNLMAMNYGRNIPNGDIYMGQYTITTTLKSKEQLEEIGLLNTKIGITTMIGKNDSEGLIFTQENAIEVLNFAKENEWIKYLSFWSINRDNGDGEFSQDVNSKYSSISQELFEFTTIFENFNLLSDLVDPINPYEPFDSYEPNNTNEPFNPFEPYGPNKPNEPNNTNEPFNPYEPYGPNEPNNTNEPIDLYYNSKVNKKCGNDYGKCSDSFCCSKYGYCGKGDNYCGYGCQKEYGNCENQTELSKKTCGPGIGSCSKGLC